MIKIFRHHVDRKVVALHHVARISEKEIGIGLEMHHAPIDEEMAVALHKISGGEAFARVLHLRIGEGQPDFLHLVGRKEPVDNLDAGAQESHVGQSLLQSELGTRPHAGAFDVDADEIHLREKFGQADGIFPFAASQLKNDGMVVVEILLAPVAFHCKRYIADDGERVLKHVLEGLHLSKLRQFSFSHDIMM